VIALVREILVGGDNDIVCTIHIVDLHCNGNHYRKNLFPVGSFEIALVNGARGSYCKHEDYLGLYVPFYFSGISAQNLHRQGARFFLLNRQYFEGEIFLNNNSLYMGKSCVYGPFFDNRGPSTSLIK